MTDSSRIVSGFILVAVLLGTAALPAPAEDKAVDWPQFWGPNRDGTTSETGLQAGTAKKPPRKVWSRNVGVGYAGVSVCKGRVYTLGNANGKDVVWCLDADTGSVIWQHGYKEGSGGGYPGPRSTPTVDGNYVYTLSRGGRLLCLDGSARGKRVWSKDAKRDLSGHAGGWGFACSPLVMGNKLIVDVGAVSALDKRTGEVLWTTREYKAGYCSPKAFTYKGRTYVTAFNSFGLLILDPEDGREISKFAWKTRYDVNAAMPVISGDRIFITSGYGTGGTLLRLTDQGLKQVWKNKKLGSQFTGCLLRNGYLYGFDGNVGGARMKCLQFDTGQEKWAHRYSGTAVLAGDKLVILGNSGRLAMAEPDPTKYRELWSKKLPKGTWWNMPVVWGRSIYCRSHEGKLICLRAGK